MKIYSPYMHKFWENIYNIYVYMYTYIYSHTHAHSHTQANIYIACNYMCAYTIYMSISKSHRWIIHTAEEISFLAGFYIFGFAHIHIQH